MNGTIGVDSNGRDSKLKTAAEKVQTKTCSPWVTDSEQCQKTFLRRESLEIGQVSETRSASAQSESGRSRTNRMPTLRTGLSSLCLVIWSFSGVPKTIGLMQLSSCLNVNSGRQDGY